MSLLLQQSYNLIIHIYRDLRLLNQFIRFGEVEIFFDSATENDQVVFLVMAGCFDSVIEETVYFGR